MTVQFRGEPRTSSDVPQGVPENHLYKAFTFMMSQSRTVRIGALALIITTFAALVVLAYASAFSAHSDGPRTGGTQPSASKKVASEQKNSASSPSTQKTSHSSNSGSPIKSGSTVSSTHPSLYPASILNLTNWKLTLPVGKDKDPTEIDQPQLATYSLSPYFLINTAGDGVQFMAPVGGVTTSGSKFPRSELREMAANGGQEASWSTTTGTSVMNVREAINHLPNARPQLVAAQIHGPSAYVILVRLNGSDLFVENDNGDNVGDLDTNYKLGSIYNLQITAANGHIQVSYNGVQKVDEANTTSGDYFKAGCYIQSNQSYGDTTAAYGQTTIYSLSVSHS